MSIVLLVMTDGRGDCLTRTLAAFDDHVTGPITRRVIHDDSGDPTYRQWLAGTYPDYELVSTPGRSGFGGAIQSAWRHLLAHADERWVFHLEDDFAFHRPVNLADLADVLDSRPYLTQLAFRRQPWNADERAAGGIVEQYPSEYHDQGDDAGREWLEHRRFFTTNPSLYRRSLCEVGWPDGAHSEGHFGLRLTRDGMPGVPGEQIRFGFWGARDSGEWVEHIGHQRAGVGY